MSDEEPAWLLEMTPKCPDIEYSAKSLSSIWSSPIRAKTETAIEKEFARRIKASFGKLAAGKAGFFKARLESCKT